MNKKFTLMDVLLVISVIVAITLVCGAFFHLGITYGRNTNAVKEYYIEDNFEDVKAKPSFGDCICDCEDDDEDDKPFQNDFVKDQVLITFNPEVSDKEATSILDGIKEIKSYEHIPPFFTATLKTSFKNRKELNTFCDNLKKEYSNIKYCEPNNIIKIGDCSKGPC